ncbi:MAG: prolyl oligopeptidase family serine peptidase, partial [Leifsonia sp.]
VAVMTPDSFGELALLEPEADGGLELLTGFGGPLRVRGLVTPVELTVAGRDGYPVHGWVAMPAGDGPHPVLLNIHGGPFAQYSVHLFDETQVYVDAGYAVVYCNPRGSAGYGEPHGRVIKDAMGTVDLHDVLDFLDGAIAEHPQLDGARVGILGGSYGGYLTAWTIAHDHRWAGAIVERGFLYPDAFIGTSDIGSFFSAAYTGDSAEHRATQSPQAVVTQVSTPTLVLHSELDLRCPLPQAESYYSSLKRNGVAAELVIFPGENHELSRSGRPRHRRQRFEIILDWWSRMLPVEP